LRRSRANLLHLTPNGPSPRIWLNAIPHLRVRNV
jgi:hypothetical protein